MGCPEKKPHLDMVGVKFPAPEFVVDSSLGSVKVGDRNKYFVGVVEHTPVRQG